jgi:hypothetical protein
MMDELKILLQMVAWRDMRRPMRLSVCSQLECDSPSGIVQIGPITEYSRSTILSPR